MPGNIKRIQLLSDTEVEELYTRPEFSTNEQALYFSLNKYEAQFHTHLCELLKYYPKAHSALRQLLGYFDSQQVVIPTYRKLQDMFTHAFSILRKRGLIRLCYQFRHSNKRYYPI